MKGVELDRKTVASRTVYVVAPLTFTQRGRSRQVRKRSGLADKTSDDAVSSTAILHFFQLPLGLLDLAAG